MRNLLIITLLATLSLVGCKKKSFNIDPEAKIAVDALSTKVIPSAPYSMDTIITYAFQAKFWVDKYDKPLAHGIVKHDLFSQKIWFGDANCAITKDRDGNPQLGFFVNNNMRDVVLVAARRKDNNNVWLNAIGYYDLNLSPVPADIFDTIAYVPNKVVRAAEDEIHAAFNSQDYDKCLQLFETAYVFQPITGAQWRALKAKNEQ